MACQQSTTSLYREMSMPQQNTQSYGENEIMANGLISNYRYYYTKLYYIANNKTYKKTYTVSKYCRNNNNTFELFSDSYHTLQGKEYFRRRSN